MKMSQPSLRSVLTKSRKDPTATHSRLAWTPPKPYWDLSGLALDTSKTRLRPNMDIFVI